MMIISGSSNVKLAKQISKNLKCELIIANTKRFPDQELRVQVNRDLYKQDIIILQSTTRPANDNLMELLLLADIAKRSGSERITAIIPYFGYSRQDRPSYTFGPISASLIAKLIETSGVDRVVTVDIHSKQSEGFFKIGIKNLDPTGLFISRFKDNKNYIVVSPDIGGLTRAKGFASKLGTDIAIINKSRDINGECTMFNIIGDIKGKDCIIIDDIVDTGGTLCKAAHLLIENGAKSVSACVTHAVFSDDCIHKIEQAKFKSFFITDTIPHQKLPSFIKIVAINNLISKEL